jgi:hypothetical protein
LHFENKKRDQFVDKELINFGFGTRNSVVAKQQIQNIRERHDEAVKKCLANREALINTPGRFRTLDTTKELLLEMDRR